MKINLRKRNAVQAADRLFEFYERRMQDRILATINIRNPVQKTDKPQDPDANLVKERDPISWKHLDWLLQKIQSAAKSIELIEDDRVCTGCEPAFHFEGGLETAMLGGKVRWVGTNRHTWGEPKQPLVKNYEEFDWKLPSEDNVWFQRFLESFRYMVKHANGEFAVGYMCVLDGINMAVQLRGVKQAYLDIYDHPHELHRLIEWGCEFNKYLYDRVIEIIRPYNESLYDGHHLNKYSVIPRMSVDAYSLCAPGTLSKWGLKELSNFSSYVGGSNFHIHEDNRHTIEEFVKMKKVLICCFTEGPGYPRTFDIRWDMRRQMQDVPIAIGCNKEEFLRALHSHDLPCNTTYSFTVDSLEEGNEIMKVVRDYRPPAKGGEK